MSPIILVILVVVCVGAAGIALVPALTGGGRADKRLKELSRSSLGSVEPNRVVRDRDERRRTVQASVDKQAEALKKQQKRKVSLQAQLYQAGMKIKKPAFIRNSVILGLGVFALCFLLEVPLLYAFVFAAASAYLLPKFVVAQKRKRFQAKFLDELPNAVEAIVRGVKSGLPLNDSIRIVAKEAKEPVRTEFAKVIDAQAVGQSMDDAIQSIYERVPLSEVNFFVVVISVQQKAGGNLSEALTNLARVLRDRKKMKGKIKAMSSEAKASAMIIGSLPFIVAGLVSVVTPSYLLPLFVTPIGNICLGVAALMMSTGIFIMNRMIQFNY